MPSKVEKTLVLKQDVVEVFGKRFPSKRDTNRVFTRVGAKGRGDGTWHELKSGMPVSPEIAEAFTDWMIESPERFPLRLTDRVGKLGLHDAVLELFAPVSEEHVYVAYDAPKLATNAVDSSAHAGMKLSNDPTGRGLGGLAVAVAHTIFRLRGKLNGPFAKERYLNPVTGPVEYDRLCHIEAGYNVLPKGKKATPDQAEEYGRQWSGYSPDYFQDFCRRLINFNRDFVRYAIDQDGRRVGVSAVYKITDAAWQATLRGERTILGYPDDEITSSGNNFVLEMLAEDFEYSEEGPKGGARNILVGSLLMQVAILLDTSLNAPVRAISYEIIKGNSIRLRNVGYERVCHFDRSAHGKPSYHVVVFDPVERAKKKPFGYITSNMMCMVDDFVRRIRKTIDAGDRQ